jgi:hypothetical protein
MCRPRLSRTGPSVLLRTFRKSSHSAWAWARLAGPGRLTISRAAACRLSQIVNPVRLCDASRGHCCGSRRRGAAGPPGLPCRALRWLVCPCLRFPTLATLRVLHGGVVVTCRIRGQKARVTITTQPPRGRAQRAEEGGRVARTGRRNCPISKEERGGKCSRGSCGGGLGASWLAVSGHHSRREAATRQRNYIQAGREGVRRHACAAAVQSTGCSRRAQLLASFEGRQVGTLNGSESTARAAGEGEERQSLEGSTAMG